MSSQHDQDQRRQPLSERFSVLPARIADEGSVYIELDVSLVRMGVSSSCLEEPRASRETFHVEQQWPECFSPRQR